MPKKTGFETPLEYPDEADTELTMDRVNEGLLTGTFVRPICLSDIDSTIVRSKASAF